MGHSAMVLTVQLLVLMVFLMSTIDVKGETSVEQTKAEIKKLLNAEKKKKKSERATLESCERGKGADSFPYKVVRDEKLKKWILCDTQTDDGGWIVIQRRAKGDVKFTNKNWAKYRKGFGRVQIDHWLGNEPIHQLTNKHDYELRIDLIVNGEKKYARYSSFKLEDESDKYRLRLGSYSGTIGETFNVKDGSGLTHSKDMQFTTIDSDNDLLRRWNCARGANPKGAWWYRQCHRANLNGNWRLKRSINYGVSWYAGTGWLFPTFTEMKIRRIKSAP